MHWLAPGYVALRQIKDGKTRLTQFVKLFQDVSDVVFALAGRIIVGLKTEPEHAGRIISVCH
ncbi:hypothetical protein PUN4_240009 [Paraburkholderia unamae]|nr:hypothetical protein PUN4_240009 [Paraburkholderia unamae]